MALAGDSILVTPGAGAVVATETISSKEHQVIMLADAYGHIIGGRDVYVFSAVAMAKAASKIYLTLFNADAALKVDIALILINQELTAAVTGLVRGMRLFRTTSTAPSAGTALTAVKLKSASPALDVDITGRGNGVTATASGDAIGIAGVGEEETGAGGAGSHVLFSEQAVGEPIVLSQNEGVMVAQDSTAGTGLLSALVFFRPR